jgi:hypothetical protein
VLYDRLTVSEPFELKRAGGFLTMLPAAKRGHGLVACAAAAIGVATRASVSNSLKRTFFTMSLPKVSNVANLFYTESGAGVQIAEVINL